MTPEQLAQALDIHVDLIKAALKRLEDKGLILGSGGDE